MAYLTFNSGPGSQQGMDIASAMLQQRMGGGSPLGGQNMSLMFRRDPRAATALIQAQLAAQESAADRSQRGDIAGQELGFRREALGANMQSAEAERAAAMNRMLAQIGAQTGLAKERMSFEERLNEADKIARASEAAKQRAFLGSQQASQQKFQGDLFGKQMQHQTGLAAMQAAAQMALQQIEQSGRTDQSKRDAAARIMSEFAAAAASQDPAAWATVQPRIPEIMAGIAAPTGQAGYAPPPKPEPKTAAAQFRQKSPELSAEWDAMSMEADGETKKTVWNFLSSMPIEDIENNQKELKAYIASRYGAPDLEDEIYTGSFDSPKVHKKVKAIRKALGMEPQSGINAFMNDVMLGDRNPVPDAVKAGSFILPGGGKTIRDLMTMFQ